MEEIEATPVARYMQPARGHDTLGTTPEDWIVVTCDQCKRRGECRKETLLALFDRTIQMPSLLAHIAAWRDCGLAKTYFAMDEKRRATSFRECRIVCDLVGLTLR